MTPKIETMIQDYRAKIQALRQAQAKKVPWKKEEKLHQKAIQLFEQILTEAGEQQDQVRPLLVSITHEEVT